MIAAIFSGGTVDVATDIDADRAPTNLSWAWTTLAIALFFGLLSFAAILSIRADCRDVYLASDYGRLLITDNGRPLTTDQQSCRLAL